MALARSRRERGVDYWPGFVDALSTLLLGIIFLLSIFSVVQFYLSQEISGKDTALQRLNAQIAQLTDLLALEKTGRADLEALLGTVRSNLSATESERDRLRGLAEGAGSAAAAQGRASELAAALDLEKQSVARALAQVELLNQQIAALRRQLGALEAALEVSEKRERDSQTKIADLGQRLNLALAQRVQELQRYRSDFFGRLRQILGTRPDVRIVGDRFVFQSEVFFDPGQAVLKPEGRAEIDKIAAALTELEKKIPPDIAWVHAGRRPHRHPADRQCAVSLELGIVVGARDRGGAVHDLARHLTAAAGRRRLRRVPAARHRQDRRGLPPQPQD